MSTIKLDLIKSGGLGSDGFSPLASVSKEHRQIANRNNLNLWLDHKQIDTKRVCQMKPGGHAGQMINIKPGSNNPGKLTDNVLMPALLCFEISIQQSRS